MRGLRQIKAAATAVTLSACSGIPPRRAGQDVAERDPDPVDRGLEEELAREERLSKTAYQPPLEGHVDVALEVTSEQGPTTAWPAVHPQSG